MQVRVLPMVLVLAAGTAAMAQELQWTERIDSDDSVNNHKAEVALAVDRGGRDLMVAWMHYFTILSHADIAVYYNVAPDGESFVGEATLPLPPNQTHKAADPMVAFSDDGTGWVGSLNTTGQRIFWVSKKDPGEHQAEEALPAHFPDHGIDKGVLIGGPDDYVGLTFARNFTTPNRYHVWAIGLEDLGSGWNYEDRVPVGADWYGDPPVQIGNEGGPNGARILRNGHFAGRWLVAHHHPVPQPGSIPDYLRPRVAWSEDGRQWENAEDPQDATVPCDAGDPNCVRQHEQILWFNPNHPTTILPNGGPFVINIPSIAADPSDEGTVYMVFMGRTSSTGTNNIDLFIARSVDGGENFSEDPAVFGSPLGSQVLHLREKDLCECDPTLPPAQYAQCVAERCEPAGAIQFLPSITVDLWGGINIFYYVAWQENSVWQYRYKYARIGDFRTYPAPEVFNLTLTPGTPPNNKFHMNDPAVHTKPGARPFLGDYLMADSRGCEIYGGYVSRHEGGAVGVYVSYIDLCLDADVDRDGQLTSADVDLFVTLFANEDPRADLNRDGQFTIDDVNRFWASFNCGCNP